MTNRRKEPCCNLGLGENPKPTCYLLTYLFGKSLSWHSLMPLVPLPIKATSEETHRPSSDFCRSGVEGGQADGTRRWMSACHKPGLLLRRDNQELFILVSVCICFQAPAVSVISQNPHVFPTREVGQALSSPSCC